MKNTKNKLSLDQFKAKSRKTTESLDLISGGILGACHDDPPRPKGEGAGAISEDKGGF